MAKGLGIFVARNSNPWAPPPKPDNRAADAAAVKQRNQAAAKKDGEAHLKAAAAPGLHPDLVRGHKDAAAENARQAGGAWDESKHPRDANGKFT